MNNELYHFGVKGMKWGVRRYQNKDGTLTEQGKMRARSTFQTELLTEIGQGTGTNNNKRRVISKYDKYRNDRQRKATENYRKSVDEYEKYVDKYYKTHKDTQTRYEHDYDDTKTGKKLLSKVLDSYEAMEKAHVGEEWFWKYAKELSKASFKDYMSDSREKN